MHDRDGQPLRVGDLVALHCEVKSLTGEDGYCNASIETVYPMYPGDHKSSVTVNTKQTVKMYDANSENGDKLLPHFSHTHLPPHLAAVSRPFCELARLICNKLPGSAERTVALRKLLEGKDAAVRAAVDLHQGGKPTDQGPDAKVRDSALDTLYPKPETACGGSGT